MEEKEIKLTKEQFLTLAKLVFAGDFLLTFAVAESKKRHEEYKKMMFYIVEKLGKEFGYPDLLMDVEGYGDEKIQNMIQEDIDLYDDDIFWGNLIKELSIRDFYKKYSKNEIMKMTKEESFNKLMDIEDFYEKEFNKNGIDNLVIKTDSKNK